MKKKTSKRGLIAGPKAAGGLTMDQVVSHPAFVELSRKLEDARAVMAGLPEAIGRAVSAAMSSSALPASGPAVPVVEAKDIEISLRKVTADGKEYDFPRVKPEPKRYADKNERERDVKAEEAGLLAAGWIKHEEDEAYQDPVNTANWLNFEDALELHRSRCSSGTPV